MASVSRMSRAAAPSKLGKLRSGTAMSKKPNRNRTTSVLSNRGLGSRMGKKVKEDKKGPADDVFDPLLVESHQAGTVVLMLSSPEEEVLAKACEAIYKFVDKCDENKKILLDLGAVDGLLRLISHEDRLVRRNACMALGVMAAHGDSRRMLRKRGETIPAMVNLLAPEEDSVVHEFAALCLTSMAQDYSTKIAIFEQDGLEPLIRLLSSSDPDVQKNAIETISLLVQDYQIKSALNELSGFSPVLDLLRSDYAVIQHLALVTLQRATEDAENRAALRELEGINRLIDFIGHPEWNDLHVFAVMVIANCLEDKECMEAIKENGGLQRLVAFITDTQPPEEEEKKGGKEKKGASRAGKKGKDDDAFLESQRGTPKPRSARGRGKGGDEKGRRGDGESVIQTIPEVKQHAAKAIARAAKNPDNRKILHEQEVEKMLILLLGHEDPNVQVAAAQALGVMAENLVSRDAIGQWEGIEPLVKMLRNDSGDVREASSMALANLTPGNMNNCNEVMAKKGIEPLIDMLSDARELVCANSAIVLTNLATDEALQSEAQRLGIVTALIEPLTSGNTEVASNAALAVAAFVGDDASRTLFRENNGIEPLVQLLHSRNDDVRRSASWAISVVAIDEPTAIDICKTGGLDVLQNMQLSETKRNAFTDIALGKLLDSNLSAKYALTGKLGAGNLITDGFFDLGQVRPGTKILTLEEYYKMAINQKRPILLINPKPEKPPTPAPQSEMEQLEKSSKSSVTGRSSRQGGRGSSSTTHKGRREKEKEEKKEEDVTKETEETVAEVLPFSPPGDPALIKDLEDVQERIQPLPTTRDQVTALAQFVADKMGGAIERGQVSNFSWELPISQLKLDLQSNVLPIGYIRTGIHYHRALLFKVLADRIAVGSSLVRGEYNRAWNVVMLTGDPNTTGGARFPPKPYIVDLIHQPGMLMKLDSPEALSYQKL